MKRSKKNRVTEALDMVQNANESALLADGFNDALIGVCYQFGRPPVAAYDLDKIIGILMKRDKMTRDEAVEFWEFNIVGSGMGENNCVYIEQAQS